MEKMKASIFLTIVLFSINVLQPKKYLIEVADKEKSSRKTVEPLADDDNSVAEESKTSVRTSKSSRITQVQSMLTGISGTTWVQKIEWQKNRCRKNRFRKNRSCKKQSS